MAILESFFTSVISGGATGVIGVVVQRIAEYKTKKLELEGNKEKFAHEVAMRKADAEIMAQEWSARTQVATVDAAAKADVSADAAFAASFNEPAQYSENVQASRGQGWMLVLLDLFRGLIRPFLTLYLCILVTYIYAHAVGLIGEVSHLVTSQQVLDLLNLIIGTILYLMTTCVLWWFGTRNKQSAPKIR